MSLELDAEREKLFENIRHSFVPDLARRSREPLSPQQAAILSSLFMVLREVGEVDIFGQPKDRKYMVYVPPKSSKPQRQWWGDAELLTIVPSYGAIVSRIDTRFLFSDNVMAQFKQDTKVSKGIVELVPWGDTSVLGNIPDRSLSVFYDERKPHKVTSQRSPFLAEVPTASLVSVRLHHYLEGSVNYSGEITESTGEYLFVNGRAIYHTAPNGINTSVSEVKEQIKSLLR